MIIGIVSMVTIVLMVTKEEMLNQVEKSIHIYMDYLEDMISMSTYDSLKKGNMRSFNHHLQEIGGFKDVKEFSLLSKEGTVKYSSDQKRVGEQDATVLNLTKKTTVLKDGYAYYYFPVLTVEYCTRCHLRWEDGSINSFYKIGLSREALKGIRDISYYASGVILFGGVVLVIMVYALFYYFEGKQRTEVITESEKKYRSLFENMMDVQYASDRDGNLQLISPSGVKLMGYDHEDELLGCNIASKLYYNPADRTPFLQAIAQDGMVSNYELKMKRKDGAAVIVETNVRAIVGDTGKNIGYEGVFRDITSRKSYEEQLLLLASVFENTIEGIIITDSEAVIQRVNPAFIKLTGYTTDEVIGCNPRILSAGRHDDDFYKKMWEVLLATGSWSGEIWNRRKSGEVYPEWLSINAIIDIATGMTTHYVAVFHDISEIKDSEDKLRYQANHDVLTGLPNRQLFTDRLEMAVAYAHRNRQRVGVLFLDLDNFKNINDTAGHHVGDSFLIEVANRLKTCCRDEDTVARLGGDEFTLILPDVKDTEAVVMIVHRIFKALLPVINIQGHELYAGASIGVTLFPDDAQDMQTLVKNADMAMYKAKEQGKGSFQLFTEDMHDLRVKKVTLENSLRKALENGEIKVFFQPKVSVDTGKVVGLEALARWERSPNEFESPDNFISLAEETGLIFQLGEQVLLSACKQLKEWHNCGHTQLTMAVNLSARQFQDEHLKTMICRILEETGVSGASLQLEITENVAMRDYELAIETMNQLSAVGVRFALDDFGTGHSSLGYLKQFPLEVVKIDRSFIRDIPANDADVALVKAIISMAHSLGLRVVAEGVENQDQLAFLKSLNCDEVQGYLLSHPLDSESLTVVLEKENLFHDDI